MLVQGTDFILLDEPSSHLDIHHRFALMELLRSLAGEGGKGVVAVLHDLDLASRFCDRIVVLEGGTAPALGEPPLALSEEVLRSVFKVKVSRETPEAATLLFSAKRGNESHPPGF